MIKILLPYIKLYKRDFGAILLGVSLAILALFASIFLLSLSGWFLAATAFIGVSGLYTFNYMLPAAGVRGAAIFRTAARYFERLLNHNITFKILAYLRLFAFKHILPLSAEQLQQYQKADLLNRFIHDIDNLDHLYLKLFTPMISALVIIGCLFFGLSYFSLPIASVISFILLVAILLLPIGFYQAGKQLGKQLTQQQSDYREKLVNYLQGQAELTLFNAEPIYRQQLDLTEQIWQHNQQKQTKLINLASSLIILIIGLMVTLVIYFAMQYLPNDQQPIIALFIFAALSCNEILAPIPNAFIFLGQVIESAKRMNNVMNTAPNITFPTETVAVNKTQGNIQFSNITFSYPNQPAPILTKINLTIHQGEHIALIGQTGCGKSTLLSLLMRSWRPDQGTIMINQIAIEDFDEKSLREMIAVIPQSIDIFSDTLRNNLLIANPSATDEQLIKVLSQVELDKLCQTKQGLSLWIGDSGRALSGGEKRRIGIARALLIDAPIVLMDEPTESLDDKTEQQIIRLIETYYQHKTVIMVTHRLTNNVFFNRTLQLYNAELQSV